MSQPTLQVHPGSALDLQRLREALEEIDREILGCFKKRMELVDQIGSAKLHLASPFRDKPREEQVLHRIRQTATEMGLDAHQVESIYRVVLDMAVSRQQAYVQELASAPLRVAYHGVEGSFSHLTAQRRFRGRTGGVLLNGCESFRAAVQCVRDGAADLAILPIENSTAGSINETYDLLAEGGLVITAEMISKVSHCLVGLPGTRLEQLRRVISHPQALMQCEAFLRKLPWARPQSGFDTAGSARKVKEEGDPTVAAIASASAASRLGLEILARDIQTRAGNSTRFVEVALHASPCPADVPCKTSLMLITEHQPGSLAKILGELARRNVNLAKLESRPHPGQVWHYRFYLDLAGHAASRPIAEALEIIRPMTEELLLLGTYPAAGEAVDPAS